MTKAHKKPQTQTKMNTKHESVWVFSGGYILCSLAFWDSCCSKVFFFGGGFFFTAHLDQDFLEEKILNFNGNFLIKLIIKKENNG